MATAAVGSSAAMAQPAAASSAARRATDAAMVQVATLERERAGFQAQHEVANRAYSTQLRAVDDLKRQKASWRRASQLRSQLAASQAQARDLKTLDDNIKRVDGLLHRTRAQAVAAVDAEAARAAGARIGDLAALRRKLVPSASVPARRIVVPDAAIDPLADPEELDQQAQLLRDTERDLGREIASLDAQASSLRRAAALRAQHDRAGELAVRDDDGPRRQTGGDGRSASIAGAPAAGDAELGGLADATTFAGATTAAVLRDIIDASTGDLLRRADRLTDPAAKADAATRARAQAATRQAALAAQRQAIEARARELRK